MILQIHSLLLIIHSTHFILLQMPHAMLVLISVITHLLISIKLNSFPILTGLLLLLNSKVLLLKDQLMEQLIHKFSLLIQLMFIQDGTHGQILEHQLNINMSDLVTLLFQLVNLLNSKSLVLNTALSQSQQV